MMVELLALDPIWRWSIIAGVVILSALIGWFLGGFRNRRFLGLILGVLGPIGWLSLFLIQSDYVPCPECGARAHPRWARCPACRCDLQRALLRTSNSQQRAARAYWR